LGGLYVLIQESDDLLVYLGRNVAVAQAVAAAWDCQQAVLNSFCSQLPGH
jgi:hypothetical protein